MRVVVVVVFADAVVVDDDQGHQIHVWIQYYPEQGRT